MTDEEMKAALQKNIAYLDRYFSSDTGMKDKDAGNHWFCVKRAAETFLDLADILRKGNEDDINRTSDRAWRPDQRDPEGYGAGRATDRKRTELSGYEPGKADDQQWRPYSADGEADGPDEKPEEFNRV